MLKNMSLETRNSSALCKRAEQLKRWEGSDTNRESVEPKNPTKRKIQFSSGCIFLAACVAGDKDEVERLLDDGADIDTSNVDGLTALHQACIDNNLEMVEFLIQRGSDINRKDNEGWTPLHATASCGFLSIARFLIENSADLAAVNSDGDLPIDIAYNDDMEDLIDKYVCEQGIDCVEARQTEEKLMLNDAKKWLRSDASEADQPHPKTGATALHVAAAKGYTKVLSLLLAGRADVDKQDVDGWTPLHAAAYWGQKEAAQMLVASLGDLEIKNYAGQTPVDIATKELVTVLEELKKNSKRTKRRPGSQIRISDSLENNLQTPPKVIRVEVNLESKNTEICDDKPKTKPEPITTQTTKEANEIETDAPWRRITSMRNRPQQDSPPKIIVPEIKFESEVILRRSQNFENDEKKTSISSPLISPSTAASVNITNSTVSSGRGQIRRSFVPPTRDEESETQRKAHAKRVRETRRSTQGVTLDEIKSAEKLVKKKNASNADFKLEDASKSPTLPSTTSVSTRYAIVAPSPNKIWDNTTSTSSSFSAEPSVAERKENLVIAAESTARPLSAPMLSTTTHEITINSNKDTSTEITPPLRRVKSSEDKENDKENDNRSAQATQAVIQRRRRPKRRSTGVVHVDTDDNDPDRQESPVDGDDKESGTEQPSTRVSIGSNNDLSNDIDLSSNGELIDFKALYEAVKADNDKLKISFKKKDEDLVSVRGALERFTNATTKNSLSELEKREKRAMERKISEMEEELKQLDALKSENQRLKDENGALIRVISKLSK